jgi:N-acetylmuramoyl-L-alanine amidase
LIIRPSPNVEPRRGGGPVDILLLHYTGMASAEAACTWLCAPESKVSCHYLIDEDGRVTQIAEEGARAWHAGASSWRGETDINSRSIGIEIHNRGHNDGYPDFPPAQMRAVIVLCQAILARHPIPPWRVLAHSDVAPARKIDPGEKFGWRLLHENGIGHWVPPTPVTGGRFLQIGDAGDAVAALKSMLASYGYGIAATPEFDLQTEQVLRAFQRHFRPARVDGVADPSTVDTLRRLSAALPAGGEEAGEI